MKKSVWYSLLVILLTTSIVWAATYTGTTIPDLVTTTPDGSVEPVSILDDAVREVKTTLTGTKYSWTKLTNKTGVALVAGDVVALDTGNNSAVALDDTSLSLKTFVVAVQSIANGSDGLFARSGVIVTVNTNGAVTRGHYVKKSSTTKVIDTQSIAMSSTLTPPIGSVGVALTTASAGVTTVYWFGNTIAGNPTGISGQIVTGGTDPGWTVSALHIGTRAVMYQDSGIGSIFGRNIYTDGTKKYIATAATAWMGVGDGVISFSNAASGTAGTAITPVDMVTIGLAAGGGGISVGAATGGVLGTGIVNIAGAYYVNNAAGLSSTTSVRAAGGAGDCTLIFTGGIKTGGSC